MSKKDYDVIVIGSGAGGLSAALPLAQAGKSVLVCEQHEVPGGWTHSFTLEGYRFSPGVHYIGGLGPGGRMRSIYEGLGVSRDLEFCELNPDGYDHFLIGDKRFDFPKGRENLADRLKERFPDEVKGIDGYLNAVSVLMDNVNLITRINRFWKAIRSIFPLLTVLKWAKKSGRDLIDHFISDPLLKAILSGQSGDHGLPPNRVSAFIHAGITHHYFDGGYYPRGGAYAIPRAFVRALKRAGGEIIFNSPVEHILIEDKRAIGVQLANGDEIRAEYVISNADPEMTFGRMIGIDKLSTKLNRKLQNLTWSTSCISLFFVVDMDLKAAGLDSGNFWLYDHTDLDAIYESGRSGNLPEGETLPGMFLTVTTLKDPSKNHDNRHTCEAFSFMGYDAFEQWSGEKQGERSESYQKFKEKLAQRMIKTLDNRFPGMAEHITFWDLGTPLTNEHYINTVRGNLYGIEKSIRQVGPGAFAVKSEFKGLYLCGASTLSHGVAGATASGLEVAKQILHCGSAELLKQNGPELKIYPSEDLSQWPDELISKSEKHPLKTATK